jgi:hypothetical protein
MSVLAVWAAGLRGVLRTPVLLSLLWALTVAVAIPPALALENAVRTHLGASLAADSAAEGVNADWLQEFRDTAGPAGRSLRPDVIGFAAVMDNSSALADNLARPSVIVVTGTVYVVSLWFLTPGIIRRLASDRQLFARGFLEQCGAFSLRLLRMGAISVAAYGVLFGTVHPWLLGDLYDTVTYNMTVERTAFFIRLILYVLFFALLAGINLLFDFAKVRMVVEDRRSVVASLTAAGRFITSHIRLAAGVYAMNVAAFGLVLALYAAVAPGAGSATGLSIWGGFIVSQAYIAARLFVKLAFWSSEICALQTMLAYPGFVRAEVGSPLTPQFATLDVS